MGEDSKSKNDIISTFSYPSMTKIQGTFKLSVQGGSIKSSEAIVLLGENGTGKSTLINLLAGLIKPDEEGLSLPQILFSVKPQKIRPKVKYSVYKALKIKLGTNLESPIFIREVIEPLQIESLYSKKLNSLSGGELQKIAVALTLGKDWDIYLIDEPSAHLDSEQRLIIAKVIKRWIQKSNKAAIIVEHDFIMASYLADKVIVFEGTPAKEASWSKPQDLLSGMNTFLKILDVTFRRDQ